ncbi:MAG TPA: diacylglycerol kinase family protein [Solirubrobacteraceae bacterium]
MSKLRLAAWAALVLMLGAAVLAIILAVQRFPRGISVLLCVALAASAAWYAIQRRGAFRIVSAGVAASLLAGAVALILVEGKPLLDLLILAALGGALVAAREAFRVRIQLPAAQPPDRPVMFYNPLSGGGKAERFHLADEATRRRIEPIELRRGDDLEELVRAAVRRGANGLAMAGGDGSQAIVAKVAAEYRLPYACIPAGTRNHFALDLGVDRDDVVGALDAFVNGGERRVDLAEVAGRVFVNNVSLGLYAEAVQRDGYREAKLRTLIDTVPDVFGPGGELPHLHWEGPAGEESGAAVLVSNNRYRLGRALGAGTRPRLDGGQLGITVIGPTGKGPGRGRSRPHEIHQWSSPTFEITSDRPVPAGIDGEATHLEPPLRFRILPAALQVRIAPTHPGASPSAIEPDSPLQALGALMKLALGRPLGSH